jgi:hypothetical protein
MNIFDYIIAFLFYRPRSSIDQQDHLFFFFFFFRLFFFYWIPASSSKIICSLCSVYWDGWIDSCWFILPSSYLFTSLPLADLALTDIEYVVVLVIGLLSCSSFWCFFCSHSKWSNPLLSSSLSLFFFSLCLHFMAKNRTMKHHRMQKIRFPLWTSFSLPLLRFSFCSRVGIIR